MTQRVNYDAIAESYDAHPFRQKVVDPDLLAFLKERPEGGSILDIGCGTGAQLVTISDAVYQNGLVRIEQALKKNRRYRK